MKQNLQAESEETSKMLETIRTKYYDRKGEKHLGLSQIRIDHRIVARAEEKSRIRNCMSELQLNMPIISRQWMLGVLELAAKKFDIQFQVDKPDAKGECAVFLNTEAFYFELIIDSVGRCCGVRLDHTEGSVVPVPDLQSALNNGDIERLHKHLAGVTAIYSCCPNKNLKPRVFRALDCLEKDLTTISEIQSHRLYTGSALDCVNQSPVGAITPRYGGEPMKLTYFCTAYDLLDENQVNAPPRALSGLLSSGEGQSCTVELSTAQKEYQLPQVSVVTPRADRNNRRYEYPTVSSANLVPVHGSFVLRLQRPLPVATSLIDEMHKITGLEIDDASATEEKLNLVELIVQHYRKDEKLTAMCDLRLLVCLPEQQHEYSVGGAPLPGSLLRVVPFTHVCQVPRLVALLRKQAVFNETLATCLRTPPINTRDGRRTVPIELTPASLSLISAAFERPDTNDLATVEFDLRDLRNLYCAFYSLDGDTSRCPRQLTTRIFQRCWSIPVTMRAILKRLERSATEGGNNEPAPLPPADQALRRLRQIDDTLTFVNIHSFSQLSLRRPPSSDVPPPTAQSPQHTWRINRSPVLSPGGGMRPPPPYSSPRNSGGFSPRALPQSSGAISPRQTGKDKLLVSLLGENPSVEQHVITKATYLGTGSSPYEGVPSAPIAPGAQQPKPKKRRRLPKPDTGSLDEPSGAKKQRPASVGHPLTHQFSDPGVEPLFSAGPERRSPASASPAANSPRHLLNIGLGAHKPTSDPYDFNTFDTAKDESGFKSKKQEEKFTEPVRVKDKKPSTPTSATPPPAQQVKEEKRINTVRIKLTGCEAQVVDSIGSDSSTETKKAIKTTIVVPPKFKDNPFAPGVLPKPTRGRGTLRGRGRGRGGERGRKKREVPSGVGEILGKLAREGSSSTFPGSAVPSLSIVPNLTQKKTEKKKKRKHAALDSDVSESKVRSISGPSGSGSPMHRVEPSDKGPNAIKIRLGGSGKMQVVQSSTPPPQGAAVPTAVASIRPPLSKLPKIPKLSEKKKQELQQLESKERSASPLAAVDRSTSSSALISAAATPPNVAIPAAKSSSAPNLSTSTKKPAPMLNKPPYRAATPPNRLPLGNASPAAVAQRPRTPSNVPRAPSPRGPPSKDSGKIGIRLPGPLKQKPPNPVSSLLRPDAVRSAANRGDKSPLLPTPPRGKAPLLPTPDTPPIATTQNTSPVKAVGTPVTSPPPPRPARGKSLTDVIDKLHLKGPPSGSISPGASVSQVASALLNSLTQAAAGVPKSILKNVPLVADAGVTMGATDVTPAEILNKEAAATVSDAYNNSGVYVGKAKAPASPGKQEEKCIEPVKVIPLSPVSDPMAGVSPSVARDDVFKAPTPKPSGTREDSRSRPPESPSSTSSSPGPGANLVIDYPTCSPVPSPKSPAPPAPSSSKDRDPPSIPASPSLDSIKSVSINSSPCNTDDDLMNAALIGD